jgi:hypothetical protein
MRRLDVAGLAKLWQAFGRSYTHSRAALAKTILWTFGLRPLLGTYARAAAPARMHRRHLRLLSDATPAWVAPDRALRRELDERAARAPLPSDKDGLYLREGRFSFDHPLVALEYEERFANGRDLGVRELHPLLDSDLVDFLWRVPPELLDRGGRSKGLVRESLRRRFPELGFDRQRKVNATNFFQDNILEHCETARRELGGVPALTDLGLIDPHAWHQAYETIRSRDRARAYRIWEVFSAEAWIQSRA